VASLKEKISKWGADFQEFSIDIVYGRDRGFKGRLFGLFLQGFSYLFSGIVQCRLFLYNERLLSNNALGCLVVVVGNLTVGGTGKTPVVERFAKTLQDRGRKVAILSRGYKSKKEPSYQKILRWITHAEPPPPKVVSDESGVLLGSDVAGDEPYMLARNLPGVPVIVDSNRVKGGLYAIKKFKVDTLILDDGFQYLPLRGRLNLLLVDSTNPFGNGFTLPRGILREPVKHLSRSSYIFLTKSNGNPDPAILETIHQYKPGAEVIECTHRPEYLQPVFGEKHIDLSYLQGKKVGVFSGIAVPESFEKFVRDLGAEIVYFKRFLDHHRFSEAELEIVFTGCEEAGAEIVLTTEKDAVRVEEDFETDLEFLFLRVMIRIISGVEDFQSAVERVCFMDQVSKE
jgi:tetraacyldisaccharide 4'-kinase|tara:strand:- start:80 stop:1276 length:1197 start_codon:yes stop_codon:yes gene_type:complete